MHGYSYAYLTQNSDYGIPYNGIITKVGDLGLPGGGSMSQYGCLIISLWNLYAKVCSLGYKDFPSWWSVVRSYMDGNYINTVELTRPLARRFGVYLKAINIPINRSNYRSIINRICLANEPVAVFAPLTDRIATVSDSGMHGSRYLSITDVRFRFEAEYYYYTANEDPWMLVYAERQPQGIRGLINSYGITQDYDHRYSVAIEPLTYQFTDGSASDGHATFHELFNPTMDIGVPTVDPLDYQDKHGYIDFRRRYYRHYGQVFYVLSRVL